VTRNVTLTCGLHGKGAAMKTRKGYVFFDKQTQSWKARFTYTDNNGKRKYIKRRVESKSQGEEILKKLIHTFENEGRSSIDADNITFNDLCAYYEEHYMIESQYANNRKVAGLRSVTTVRGYVRVFRQYLGKRKIKTLTYDDLRSYKLKRLITPTHQSAQRSLTTVNRELAYLRRILNIAERNGWIHKNPFRMGDPLIHIADEVKRERIITREEETKLLTACTGPRTHLRPIIIAALDTGCRLGELLKMRWRDIDIDAGLINIEAFNTKTMKERQVAVTTRLTLELEGLWVASAKDVNALVFGVTSVIRQGFNKACKDAGLVGLRAHDLRHTHATRLDDLGFSLAKIGGQLGHTVVQTTLRYVNRNKDSIRQVASALDDFYSQENQQVEEATEMVN